MIANVQMQGEVKIGTAGWSYKDWEGIVYPAKLRGKRGNSPRAPAPLEVVAGCLDVVEINTTFYGHLRPEIALAWCRMAREANPRFVFTAKLNRAFTHSPVAVIESTSAATIRPASEDESAAKAGLDVLASEQMLGALLAQFPISFKNTDENREYLERLAERFSAYPLAFEVRHASWNLPETLAQFARRGIAFCNIDQPRLGLAIGPTEHVTAPVAYVRLHGRNYKEWFSEGEGKGTATTPTNRSSSGTPTASRDARYNYLYKKTELADWKGHIDQMRAHAKLTYVVANNHFRGQAVVNALQLKNMVEGKPVRVPPALREHYPELEEIAEEDAGEFALS